MATTIQNVNPSDYVKKIGECFKNLRETLNTYYLLTDPTHHELCDLNESITRNLSVLKNNHKLLFDYVQKNEHIPVDLMVDTGAVFTLIWKDWASFSKMKMPEPILTGNASVCKDISLSVSESLKYCTEQVKKRVDDGSIQRH